MIKSIIVSVEWDNGVMAAYPIALEQPIPEVPAEPQATPEFTPEPPAEVAPAEAPVETPAE